MWHLFSNNSLWIIILKFTTKDAQIKLKKLYLTVYWIDETLASIRKKQKKYYTK